MPTPNRQAMNIAKSVRTQEYTNKSPTDAGFCYLILFCDEFRSLMANYLGPNPKWSNIVKTDCWSHSVHFTVHRREDGCVHLEKNNTGYIVSAAPIHDNDIIGMTLSHPVIDNTIMKAMACMVAVPISFTHFHNSVCIGVAIIIITSALYTSLDLIPQFKGRNHYQLFESNKKEKRPKPAIFHFDPEKEWKEVCKALGEIFEFVLHILTDKPIWALIFLLLTSFPAIIAADGSQNIPKTSRFSVNYDVVVQNIKNDYPKTPDPPATMQKLHDDYLQEWNPSGSIYDACTESLDVRKELAEMASQWSIPAVSAYIEYLCPNVEKNWWAMFERKVIADSLQQARASTAIEAVKADDNIPEATTTLFNGIMSNINEVSGHILNGAEKVLTQTAGRGMKFVDGATGIVTQAPASVVDNLVEREESMSKGIQKVIDGTMSQIEKGFAWSSGIIEKAVTDSEENAYSADSVGTGISELLQRFGGDILDGVVNSTQKAWDIATQNGRQSREDIFNMIEEILAQNNITEVTKEFIYLIEDKLDLGNALEVIKKDVPSFGEALKHGTSFINGALQECDSMEELGSETIKETKSLLFEGYRQFKRLGNYAIHHIESLPENVPYVVEKKIPSAFGYVIGQMPWASKQMAGTAIAPLDAVIDSTVEKSGLKSSIEKIFDSSPSRMIGLTIGNPIGGFFEAIGMARRKIDPFGVVSIMDQISYMTPLFLGLLALWAFFVLTALSYKLIFRPNE